MLGRETGAGGGGRPTLGRRRADAVGPGLGRTTRHPSARGGPRKNGRGDPRLPPSGLRKFPSDRSDAPAGERVGSRAASGGPALGARQGGARRTKREGRTSRSTAGRSARRRTNSRSRRLRASRREGPSSPARSWGRGPANGGGGAVVVAPEARARDRPLAASRAGAEARSPGRRGARPPEGNARRRRRGRPGHGAIRSRGRARRAKGARVGAARGVPGPAPRGGRSDGAPAAGPGLRSASPLSLAASSRARAAVGRPFFPIARSLPSSRCRSGPPRRGRAARSGAGRTPPLPGPAVVADDVRRRAEGRPATGLSLSRALSLSGARRRGSRTEPRGGGGGGAAKGARPPPAAAAAPHPSARRPPRARGRRPAPGGRPEGPRRGAGGRGGTRASGAPSGNDPSAGSPTETLLRLLLPLDSQVRPSSRRSARAEADPGGADPRTSLNHPIGSSDGRCVQRAGT